MKQLSIIFLKELVDALRDRKTLFALLLTPLLYGPLMIGMLSFMVKEKQQQMESPTVLIHGGQHAPGLVNFLQRQGLQPQEAGADYRQQISQGAVKNAVLVIPAGFEAAMAAGESPRLALVSSSQNRASDTDAGRVKRLVRGYQQEVGQLALALRGQSAALLQPFQTDEVELSREGNQLGSMITMMLLMSVMVGTMVSALDTTAGERERSSLFPLMLNPVSGWVLVGGKWLTCFVLGIAMAALEIASFWAALAFISPQELKLLLDFGMDQAALALALLIPLAGLYAALSMAFACKAKTFKEAQSKVSLLVMAAMMLPMVDTFNSSGAKRWWQEWLPALSQSRQLGDLFSGKALNGQMLLYSALGTALAIALALAYTRRELTRAA